MKQSFDLELQKEKKKQADFYSLFSYVRRMIRRFSISIFLSTFFLLLIVMSNRNDAQRLFSIFEDELTNININILANFPST